METWMKVAWAALLAVMIWRMIPAAKHWIENGPRGEAKDWLTTAALLGGVVLFVLFLMSVNR